MSAPSAFKDHFSGQSVSDRKYRPAYPPELFAWLADVAPGHRLATELSAAQLREARADPRVEYRLEPAEAISSPSASADLLVAARRRARDRVLRTR